MSQCSRKRWRTTFLRQERLVLTVAKWSFFNTNHVKMIKYTIGDDYCKITLNWKPISTQHIYWHVWKNRYMYKKAKDLKESYIEQVKQQYNWPVLECDVLVMVILYFWDRRSRDRDNYHKLSMDALEWIVYKDDSQIVEACVIKEYDKKNPRIEITINPHED